MANGSAQFASEGVASDDLDLVHATLRGDAYAFEELVRRYDRKLLRIALSVTHNAEDESALDGRAMMLRNKRGVVQQIAFTVRVETSRLQITHAFCFATMVTDISYLISGSRETTTATNSSREAATGKSGKSAIKQSLANKAHASHRRVLMSGGSAGPV